MTAEERAGHATSGERSVEPRHPLASAGGRASRVRVRGSRGVRVAVAALGLLAACGRVGFDPRDGATDATDGALDDAAIPQVIGSSVGLPVVPGATITVSIPPTVIPGDRMYLAMYLNAQNATVTPPAAWTTDFSMPDPNLFRVAFFSRDASAAEPSTYDFQIAMSTKVAWALVAYRGVTPPVTDVSMLLAGTATATDVTYVTPSIASNGEILMIMVDDSGSGGGASAWTPPAGLVTVENGYRVAIFRGNLGAATQAFTATVDVPAAVTPHGAFRAVAW
jgi:hypothetical protein